jgi:hypothetical protein
MLRFVPSLIEAKTVGEPPFNEPYSRVWVEGALLVCAYEVVSRAYVWLSRERLDQGNCVVVFNALL